MPRLLFQKTGNAVWISHLDLMRLFQRAFKRAGLPLTHTQGFNPRPSVSIALPLSVGVESMCELLDFDLDGEKISCEQIKERLNHSLISGVKVTDVYENGKKIKDIAFLQCKIVLQYDHVVSDTITKDIEALLTRDSLVVPKKTKNGIQNQDIAVMIRSAAVRQSNEDTIEISALICCQNPSLNPMQLTSAIDIYLPQYSPAFAKCSRLELFDRDKSIFR